MRRAVSLVESDAGDVAAETERVGGDCGLISIEGEIHICKSALQTGSGNPAPDERGRERGIRRSDARA